MEAFSWKCPFCNKETTIVPNSNESINDHNYNKSNSKDVDFVLQTRIVVCPNPNCKEYFIEAKLWPVCVGSYGGIKKINDEPKYTWQLKPQSSAKLLPEYIPEQIRNDYYEACSILNLSPKASATLARRCLQGMIRDFWKISKDRLIDEINGLRNQGKINSSTMDSIDAIRKIGNIGAHMEKDVNLIIDIDEDEANMLIKLLEDLFQDWYIDRHERVKRNNEIMKIAAEKKMAKTGMS